MNCQRTRKLRPGVALLAAVAATLALAACASSSGGGSATGLLKQTFTGVHKVNSGRLTFAVTVVPSGSSTLTGPITLSFGGPFQSLGAGKLPQSDFTITLGALGHSGSIAIISTGTAGYVSFEGSSYRLPQADFEKLESSFSSLKAVPGGGGKSLLSKLGIQPLGWLVKPQVVGTETVGGAASTQIRAGINTAAFLRDFSTFLQKASSLGISGAASLPQGLSAATQSKVASEIRDPTFELWTGNADKTLRKLQVNMTLPVSGQTSTLLGGLRSANLGLTLQYADLNQPQTITAPTSLQPYSQFEAKLHAFLQEIESGIGGSLSGGLAGTGTGASGSSTTSSGSGSTASLQSYSQCIQTANGNVAKMQQCAPLLNK